MIQPHMTVTTYSHHFKVSGLSIRGKEFCKNYARRYLSYGLAKVGNSFTKVVDKVYAAADSVRSYFRFHINALKDFLDALKDQGITDDFVTIKTGPVFNPAKANIELKPHLTPKPYQPVYIDYLSKEQPVCKLVGLQTGKGKAQPLHAKIKVPDGWTTMGELSVGDYVSTPDGMSAPILDIYPQGLKTNYELMFEDGRTVDCCQEHLWSIRIEKRESLDHSFELYKEDVITTQELEQLLTLPNHRIYVPNIQSSVDAVELPIASFTKSLSFGTEFDPKYLESSTITKNKLITIAFNHCGVADLNNEGWLGIKTPQEYQALFYQNLVWSMGGLAKIKEIECGFLVLFCLPIYADSILDAAYDKMHLFGWTPKPNQGVRILGMQCREKVEMQCISIDHPDHLYITDDYIVTHNTFCALAAAARIGLRTIVIVKSMYVDKWVGDIISTTQTPRKRILKIGGSKALIELFSLAKKNKLKADFIVISINTIGKWFDMFEDRGAGIKDFGYHSTPETWYEDLQIGVRITDEVHQFFHANFKLDLYSNVKYSIPLSATLLTRDANLERMYELMFPVTDRAPSLALHKYAHSYAMHYQFERPLKIRTMEYGQSMYSHNAVERSIISDSKIFANYMKLIDETLKMTYLDNPLQGKKAAIFCSSKDMCGRVVEYLKKKYPQFDTRRYVDVDPYENAIDSDIRVTTIGSCGAAVDIPNLVTVILTQAIESIQANIQVLGRLREIVGTKVEFVFFTADNIEKHVKYYIQKKDIMRERAASFNEVFHRGLI